MMEKEAIQTAIKNLSQIDLTGNAFNLFKSLGYNTSRNNTLSSKTFEYFKSMFPLLESFNTEKASIKDWTYVDVLFQLSDAEISNQNDLWDNRQVDNKIMESYLFVVISLKGKEYTRSRLAQICREINKIFPMPVMVLFRYGDYITLSIIDRRINKRRNDKDVLEKITLIKDISVNNPHRAHIEILCALSFPELQANYTITNFVQLHTAWQKVLDIEELNNRFYNDLYNWYEWAVALVKYPSGNAKNPHILDKNNVDDEKEIRKNLIRLITRLIFVWFLKQKGQNGLIPDDIFRIEYLREILNNFNPLDTKNGNYYNAITQNLFFATLNREIKDRSFADDTSEQKNKQYGIKFYFRDDKRNSFFKIQKNDFIKLFDGVPFLNGGLFECLDYMQVPDYKTPICVDGFSREAERRAIVPNILFFGEGKKEKGVEIEKGIINIFKSYVFTIEENTPVDQDIALDPELLGKVFENLLATYNPETHESARNDTGSFYTPREIVEYMVDTSLKEYFKGKLSSGKNIDETDLSGKLDALIQYNDLPHDFNDTEKRVLIEAIDNCKILDPACGSGAFPMGVLHKLTFILRKLDPGNILWKERQKNKLDAIQDITIKKTLEETIDKSFKSGELDYSRKLYLIENCIFGVDIQTIAIQISKLRFFISLIVDQNIDQDKENLGITPLPNLETKFIAANTLVGLPKPNDDLENIHLETLKKEMLEIRHKLFSARTASEKRKYREEDNNKRKEIQRELMGYNWSSESARQIAEWDPYDQNKSSKWFDSEWMFGVKEKDGFDIIIGNPPYVEHKKLKELAALIKSNYEVYSGTADLSVYFIEKGLKLCRKNGFFTYIITNKFFNTEYGQRVREFLLPYQFRLFINFEQVAVFKNALVSTTIFGISAMSKTADEFIYQHYYKLKHDDFIAQFTTDCLSGFGIYKQSALGTAEWSFSNSVELVIKEKIESQNKRIEELEETSVFRGVTTGYNPAFIINKTTRKELISTDNKNKEIIKPILQGRNIRKWIYEESDDYLLQTGYDINIQKHYPSIYEYLKQHIKKLKERADQGVKWWNLRACKYYPEFEKEKIIWGLTADKWAFAYDNKKHYLPSNGYILTSGKIPVKYLLALLNSNLLKYYFGFIGVMTAGGAYTLKHGTIQSLPIKIAKDCKPYIELVDKILSAKTADSQNDISSYERQLDDNVYNLYGITDIERKVIEQTLEEGRK